MSHYLGTTGADFYIGTSALEINGEKNLDSVYYVGQTPSEFIGTNIRFLYAVRRDDDGNLYFNRYDRLGTETWVVNNPGDPSEDYTGFQDNVDFFEGRNESHVIVWENLIYEQWKWDNRFINYYISDNGELVVGVAEPHTYTPGP